MTIAVNNPLIGQIVSADILAKTLHEEMLLAVYAPDACPALHARAEATLATLAHQMGYRIERVAE